MARKFKRIESRKRETEKLLKVLGITREEMLALPAHSSLHDSTSSITAKIRVCRDGEDWSKWANASLYVQWDEHTDISIITIQRCPDLRIESWADYSVGVNSEVDFRELIFSSEDYHMQLYSDDLPTDEEQECKQQHEVEMMRKIVNSTLGNIFKVS